MLKTVVQRPRSDEEGEQLTLREVSSLLKTHFKGYKEETSSFQKIGSHQEGKSQFMNYYLQHIYKHGLYSFHYY